MWKSEQRELASRMTVLLAHLLKWQFQPERRGNSWRTTINVQRKGIKRRLKDMPILKSMLSDADWQEDVWRDARAQAKKETGLNKMVSPLLILGVLGVLGVLDNSKQHKFWIKTDYPNERINE